MTASAKARIAAYLQSRDKPATRGQIHSYGVSNTTSAEIQAYLDELIRSKQVATETVTHPHCHMRPSVGYRWVGKRKREP